MTRAYPPITKLAKQLHKACRDGDLQFVLDCINSDEYKKELTEQLSLPIQMLIFASMKGHVDICKAIWNAPGLNHSFNNTISLKNLLSKGFEGGHIDVINFFENKLKVKKVNFNSTITSGLISAASKGHIEVIRLFFLNKDYEELINFEFRTGAIIYAASGHNQLKVLQFLLETEGVKEKYNIHMDNDCIFKLAYENFHYDVLKYLIFELNIDKTSQIESHLIKNTSRDENCKNWFESRELKNILNKELFNHQESNHTKKLKV